MTFLSPLALAWLALVPVLVLLYLRRRAQTRRPVAALFLWRAAVQQLQARPRLDRLRLPLQLALQLAFLALVVLALAGPVVSCGGGSRVVLVLDRSASMLAAHGGRTRLEAARERAVRAVADLSGGDEVAVVSAGATPRLDQELTGDHSRARAALEAGGAGGGAGDLAAAIAFAWGAVTPRPDRVHVFTDVSADIPAAALSARVDVTRVGEPADNVGITRLAVRRHPGSTLDGQAFVEVASFGTRTARVPFRAAQGDTILLSETLTIAPGERRTVSLELADARRPLTARVEAADALAEDNAASTEPLAAPARVLVEAAGQRYVRAALAANPLVEIVESAAAAEVVVCESCTPAGRREPLLILKPGAAAAARLSMADRDHPALAFVAFDDRAVPLSPLARRGRVLVTAGDEPVIVAREEGGRRIIEIGIDMEDGSLATMTAFPILLANAVEWLRGEGGTGDAPTIPASESDLQARASTGAPAAAAVDAAARESARALWRALLLAAGVVLASLYLGFRERRAKTVRLAVAALLLACLAGFEIAWGAARRHVVFVLDVSGSIPQAERRRAADRVAAHVRAAAPGDEASLVTFGAEALVEARRSSTLDPVSLTSAPDENGSNLAAALRVAGSMAAGGGRVVLFSDGNETTGDARAEAARLGADGIAIDVVQPDAARAVRAEVLLASVAAASDARAREPFEIAAEVRSSVLQRVTVDLLREGVRVDRRTLDGLAGMQRVAFVDRVPEPGVVRYDVAVEAERDAVAENNRAGAVVLVRGPMRVLYVATGGPARGGAILRSGGVDVAQSAPEALPSSPGGFAGFDAVVLDGIPASAVSAPQREAIAAFVEKSGGGLVVTGTNGLGPGGWAATRLEELLPVDMRPPARRDASESALVLVLDKSGSMAEVENGARKIDIAIRAAVPLVDLFAASRTLGVLAFDTAAVPLVRLGDPAAAPEMLARMRALTAGGGTTIAPAVEMARSWLLASGARRRHVVLLSDGRSSPADLTALRTAASRGDVTISTVAVGQGVDRGLLQSIADRAGGRAYFPATLAQLPDIFMQEATLAASTWRIDERFVPAAENGHPVLHGVDPGGLGAVAGYVATTAKTEEAVVLTTPRRDPLLAAWPRGLGRTVVLATDLEAAWTDGLRASPAFAQVWLQAVRWAARPRGSERLHPEVAARGTRVTVAASAFTREGGFLNGLEVRAAIGRDDGEPLDVALRQVAPGRYQAPPLDLPPGFHLVRLRSASGAGPEDSVVAAVNVSAAPEHAALEPNRALLEDVARLSGGSLLRDDASPFDRAQPAPRGVGLRQALGAALLLLFVADVAMARGVLTRRRRREDAE